MAMGSVVISVDAELGWGFHDYDEPPVDRVENGRRGWQTLLALFDRFEVPATWAVVGHLLLDDCDGVHADHPSPPNWFERERTTWRDRPDLRFGPDLVEAIRDSPTDHEIGSHSFSHVIFTDPAVTDRIADAECRRARQLGREWNLDLESFVYPRNEVGHRDALAGAGFRTYRGRTPIPSSLRHTLESLARGRSLLVNPSVDEYGLVNVPASTFCFAFEGRMRSIAELVWDDPIVHLAKSGIDQAVDGDGVFHLWLHPNNLTTQRDVHRIRRILAYVDRRRTDSSLTVETMGAVGRRVSASSTSRSTLL